MVASRYESSRRLEQLSFEHHQSVANHPEASEVSSEMADLPNLTKPDQSAATHAADFSAPIHRVRADPDMLGNLPIRFLGTGGTSRPRAWGAAADKCSILQHCIPRDTLAWQIDSQNLGIYQSRFPPPTSWPRNSTICPICPSSYPPQGNLRGVAPGGQAGSGRRQDWGSRQRKNSKRQIVVCYRHRRQDWQE